ncbi:MAG TPA: response regulator [Terriglobia bacterium]|nr:response regulator [Terriglobia bacterium]
MDKILVVEDDPQVRDLMCQMLATAGLPAEAAGDGAEALERLRGEHFDLVLLDIGLPGLDGLAVLERLHELDGPPRAIMVTGDDAPGTVLRAARAQACRYVTKPIDMHVLLELVREVLEQGGPPPPIEVVSAKPDWVELLIPCTIEAAERSESFLAAIQSGVPREVAESINKAVHELVLNAVEWGGRFDPTRRVRIACVRTHRVILYRISDPGAGFQFNHLAHAALSNPPDQPAEHQRVRADLGMRPGGFGILMARALADELVYNEAQNEVLLIKYLA